MELKDKYFKVLDKGFVALKDYMGSDEDVEQAARVSYQKGTRKVNDTRNLLRYCMNHKHTSIFEQTAIKFHIKAPILVFRQWHRHRTWSYNEMSGRYSILPDECMMTNEDEWRKQSTTNKQGSGDCLPAMAVEQGEPNGRALSSLEESFHKYSREMYDLRIRRGVAKEQARKDVPVSQYSEMFATVDLHNLFHFMGLRCDSHAQLEIRSYANVMAGIAKELFPLSFQAWYDYSFNAVNFSLLDRKLISYMLDRGFQYINEEMEEYAIEDIGMSKREFNEFNSKISVPKDTDFDLSQYETIEVSNNE